MRVLLCINHLFFYDFFCHSLCIMESEARKATSPGERKRSDFFNWILDEQQHLMHVTEEVASNIEKNLMAKGSLLNWGSCNYEDHNFSISAYVNPVSLFTVKGMPLDIKMMNCVIEHAVEHINEQICPDAQLDFDLYNFEYCVFYLSICCTREDTKQ